MNLVIKTQSLPERCEICHQSDLFDPERNYCSRCSDVKVNIKKIEIASNALTGRIWQVIKATAMFGGFSGLGIGFILFFAFMKNSIPLSFVFVIVACLVGIVGGGLFGLIFGIVIAVIFTPVQAVLDRLTDIFRRFRA